MATVSMRWTAPFVGLSCRVLVLQLQLQCRLLGHDGCILSLSPSGLRVCSNTLLVFAQGDRLQLENEIHVPSLGPGQVPHSRWAIRLASHSTMSCVQTVDLTVKMQSPKGQLRLSCACLLALLRTGPLAWCLSYACMHGSGRAVRSLFPTLPEQRLPRSTCARGIGCHSLSSPIKNHTFDCQHLATTRLPLPHAVSPGLPLYSTLASPFGLSSPWTMAARSPSCNRWLPPPSTRVKTKTLTRLSLPTRRGAACPQPPTACHQWPRPRWRQQPLSTGA